MRTFTLKVGTAVALVAAVAALGACSKSSTSKSTTTTTTATTAPAPSSTAASTTTSIKPSALTKTTADGVPVQIPTGWKFTDCSGARYCGRWTDPADEGTFIEVSTGPGANYWIGGTWTDSAEAEFRAAGGTKIGTHQYQFPVGYPDGNRRGGWVEQVRLMVSADGNKWVTVKTSVPESQQAQATQIVDGVASCVVDKKC